MLDKMTVAELDDLADRHEVPNYPRSGRKADKVAALADAAGLMAGPVATIRVNARVSGMTPGEVLVVPLDRRTLNRAAAGTVTLLETYGAEDVTTDDPQDATQDRHPDDEADADGPAPDTDG